MRKLALAFLYASLLVAGWYIGRWFTDYAASDASAADLSLMNAMIMATAGLFVLVSALPFVPGAEIGFALLMLFGSRIALLVYGCMVLALMLAYLAGRFVPAAAMAALFGFFGLAKAQNLVLTLSPLDAGDRLRLLTDRSSNRFVAMLLRHRYLALILLLNLPGNTLLGGGGGIAFTAGMTGLYRLPTYFLAVLVAVAPIPAFFLLSSHFG